MISLPRFLSCWEDLAVVHSWGLDLLVTVSKELEMVCLQKSSFTKCTKGQGEEKAVKSPLHTKVTANKSPCPGPLLS